MRWPRKRWKLTHVSALGLGTYLSIIIIIANMGKETYK
jgi:hypothetical protein